MADLAVIPAISSILRNLLTSIATFWGEPELLKVIELCLDSSKASTADASAMSLLVRTVAKRASPNVLLPALCNMWTRILSENATVSPSLSFLSLYVTHIVSAKFSLGKRWHISKLSRSPSRLPQGPLFWKTCGSCSRPSCRCSIPAAAPAIQRCAAIVSQPHIV